MAAFDLIEVSIGKFQQSARPIEWDGKDFDGTGNDETGHPINPIQFMTTCPNCAQLIQFGCDDLYVAVDRTINNVKCKECGIGKDHIPSPDEIHDLVVVLDDEAIPDDDDDSSPALPSNMFVDPIMTGDFDIPIDADKLGELG